MLSIRSIALLCMGLTVPLAAAGPVKPAGDLSGPWRLLVDDHWVAKQSDVQRHWHAFTKHAGNPVMVADQPWEGNKAYLYGTVLPTENGAGYRMWYHSWDGDYRILYAVSQNGLQWDKPKLGLIDYNGSRDNNILLYRTNEDHTPQVIHTPWESNPARRYKLINFDYGRTPPEHTVTGYWGAYSADGIHWTDAAQNPVFLDHPGDVGCFTWDPHTQRYTGYPKKFADVRGFRRRCTGHTTTSDFERWPASRLILVPDEFDDRWVTSPGQHTDFYGLAGFAYESMYIGFLWVFRITDGKSDGPIFVELVSSHDGVSWKRQEHPRAPILPLGPNGTWDDGMLFTPNHPLVEGDTIKLYYSGFDATHGGGGNAAIGLATLRKDGFASLHAGDGGGMVTTKAIGVRSGSRLRINARTSRGSIRAEVLDGQGQAVPGYTAQDCIPFRGDETDHTVAWQNGTLLPPQVKSVHIRFLLEAAHLYSFNTSPQTDVGARASGRNRN